MSFDRFHCKVETNWGVLEVRFESGSVKVFHVSENFESKKEFRLDDVFKLTRLKYCAL